MPQLFRARALLPDWKPIVSDIEQSSFLLLQLIYILSLSLIRHWMVC